MRKTTPPPFAMPDPAAWSKLWFDSWALWLDAATVIWLRSLRIAAGGRLAERESRRMVAEKIAASSELAGRLARGGLTSPQAAATRVVRTYGTKVRANRRRLEG